MGDSAVTIFAIFLAAILMFVFPLMTMADKKDDVSNLSVQTATTEYTNNIRTTGVITQEGYDNFVLSLAAIGNAYEVEITVQTLDENPAKKTSGSKTTIGNNIYYVKYTTQILQELPLQLSEGDIVSVSVRIKSKTIADQLHNFIYKVTGNNTADYIAQASGIVTITK